MDDAADCHGIGEKPGSLPQASFVVHGFVLAGVEIGVPGVHVGQTLLHLLRWVFKFGEEAAGVEVMVIFVGLTEGVADFQVAFVVVCPVVFAAVCWDSAVGAFETDMGWGKSRSIVAFSSFRVVRGGGYSGLSMSWMWAVGMRFHKGCPFSDPGGRRVGEGVE